MLLAYVHVCDMFVFLDVDADGIGLHITKIKKLLLAHCREFYHSHAFLCDRENADKVTALITYGISHLDFDM